MSRLATALLAAGAAGPVVAQGLGTLASIPGRVVDLAADPANPAALLYCTAEGEVGRLANNGQISVLATAASAPFPRPLRALAALPSGALAVLDDEGNLRTLPAAGGAAALLYSDLYMIGDATDLAVDAQGTFAIASKTPSSGTRALNFVSADGQRWAYYLIAHQPLGLAADPLGGGLLFSDATAGGALRRVELSDPAHSASLLESGANPGFSPFALDGDLCGLAGGDLLYTAGAALWKFTRASASSSVLAVASGTLRGLCVALSSGQIASGTGFSAYLAEGEGPTQIREWGGAAAPASALLGSLGTVPDRGKQLMFFSGLNVFELARDADNQLLVGGDVYGANPQLRRIQLPSLASTTLVSSAQGLASRVEGIALDAHKRIWIEGFDGTLQRLSESPFALSTLFADPLNQLIASKDLALTRAGTALLAERSSYQHGQVWSLAPGASALELALATSETHGLAPDPFSARALVAQWGDAGFKGSVGQLALAPAPPSYAPLPGFGGINYSNGDGWSDGDLAGDCYGDLYTCSEDDWSVVRYERASGKQIRIGSSYLNHPAGLAIAPSTGQTPSSTGWSLYVAEWNFLWELGGVPAPAPSLLDPAAPPIGRCAGFASPAAGEPRALCASSDGQRLFLATAGARVLRCDPATRVLSEYAGPQHGLAGDLIAIATRPDGVLWVAARDGRVFEVAPGPVVSLVYDDAANLLVDLRGLALDAQGRAVLVERPAGSPAARVLRLEAGVPQLLVHSARGLRPALDPLTGELWISEQGPANAPAAYLDRGEVLRVASAGAATRAGHLRQQSFATYQHGALHGGLAFDAAGDVYLTESGAGRLWKLRRDGGPRTLIAGNYDAPKGVALAQGTPGVAGAQGASAYVLDGWAIYEHGIDGLPAPLLPSGGGQPLEFSLQGIAAAGAAIPLELHAPADAGRVYIVVPTLSGTQPGVPLAALGDAGDPRVLPINFDALLGFVGKPIPLPGFFGVLDPLGNAAPGAALLLPNDPSLLSLVASFECAWIALEPAAQSGIATVGGTAQLFLGP